MPFQKDDIKTDLQAKVFNFALTELVHNHREAFQPLWTVESWVKFLIWMSLNCGLSGEKESLEQFADALGTSLTIRMRRIFFERTLDNYFLKVLADPAETQVLFMALDSKEFISNEIVLKALEEIGLISKVVSDIKRWQILESVIAIPWKVVET